MNDKIIIKDEVIEKIQKINEHMNSKRMIISQRISCEKWDIGDKNTKSIHDADKIDKTDTCKFKEK